MIKIEYTAAMLDDVRALGERLFATVDGFNAGRSDIMDARVVSQALADVWCAFCGQLPDEARTAVLLHFCQTANQKLPGDGFTRKPEPGERPN